MKQCFVDKTDISRMSKESVLHILICYDHHIPSHNICLPNAVEPITGEAIHYQRLGKKKFLAKSGCSPVVQCCLL